MVESSPGVDPKPRFGPILDSTACPFLLFFFTGQRRGRIHARARFFLPLPQKHLVTYITPPFFLGECLHSVPIPNGFTWDWCCQYYMVYGIHKGGRRRGLISPKVVQSFCNSVGNADGPKDWKDGWFVHTRLAVKEYLVKANFPIVCVPGQRCGRIHAGARFFVRAPPFLCAPPLHAQRCRGRRSRKGRAHATHRRYLFALLYI